MQRLVTEEDEGQMKKDLRRGCSDNSARTIRRRKIWRGQFVSNIFSSIPLPFQQYFSSITVYSVIHSINGPISIYELEIRIDERYCRNGSGIDEKLMKWNRN